jgi:hypothetical protein
LKVTGNLLLAIRRGWAKKTSPLNGGQKFDAFLNADAELDALRRAKKRGFWNGSGSQKAD